MRQCDSFSSKPVYSVFFWERNHSLQFSTKNTKIAHKIKYQLSECIQVPYFNNNNHKQHFKRISPHIDDSFVQDDMLIVKCKGLTVTFVPDITLNYFNYIQCNEDIGACELIHIHTKSSLPNLDPCNY